MSIGEEVDGSCFLALSSENMTEMGIPFGSRNKIAKLQSSAQGGASQAGTAKPSGRECM